MEPETPDLDYNELDKLLGEIPDATTGSPCTGEHIHSSHLPSSEPISAHELYESSSSSSLCDLLKAVKVGDGNFVDDTLVYKTPFDQEDNSRNYHGALPVSYNQDASELQDDQSLALYLKDLGFKDGIADNSANHLFQDNQSLVSFSHHFSLDKLESAKMSLIHSAVLSEVNLPNLEDRSPSVTKTEPCEPNRQHSRIVDGYNDARLMECNFHVPWCALSDHQEQRQSFPPCSATMPVNPGMHTFFLPGVSSTGLELPPSPFQQHYYNESSYHATMHHQQLGQSSMLQCNMMDDRRHPGYHCFKHLEHQCPQGHTQRRINPGTAWASGNAAMRWFDMPIASQAEQVSLNSYEESNNHAEYHANSFSRQHRSMFLPQGQRLPPAYPRIVSHGHQNFERFGKQIFPDKVLTRSHGPTSLQISGFRSVGNNQLLEHANYPWRVIPNINIHSHLAQTDRSLNLDVWRRRGSYSDNNHYPISPKLTCVSPNIVIRQNCTLAKGQRNWNSLQSIIDKGNREDFDKIFLDILDYLIELITDPSGNYLAQKLVEFSTEEQLTRIIHKITWSSGEFVQISCNEHGTRVVQKIIETIKDPERYSMIVSALKPDIISLIKNNNGCHVAMHCLQYLSPKYREFLFEDAVANCIELARDCHGCCVIQKCVTNLNEVQKVQLIYKLASRTCELSEDPFGNYALQFVLDQEIPWVTAKILNKMEGHYQNLSVQKHSSHVVEKCLKIASDERRAGIIRELIQEPYFRQVTLDPFGNYVIQLALLECKGQLRAALSTAIKQHEPALRVNPYGKRVLSIAWYGG